MALSHKKPKAARQRSHLKSVAASAPVPHTKKQNCPPATSAFSSAEFDGEADKLLAKTYAPPSVLLNRQLQIVRGCGELKPYLKQTVWATPPNVLATVRPELKAPLQSALERARTGQAASTDATSGSAASDGRLRIEVLLLKSGQGGFVVVFQTKSSEPSNSKNEKRMKELISDLERFSYSITHDLRAPLRAMQGFAAVLEQRCGATLAPQHLDWLRRIHVSAERMDQLIQDALQYSRLLRAELPIQDVDIAGLLRKLLRAYPNLQSPAAEIQMQIQRLKVRGNESALTQCFSNLLGNAVKFVKPGTVPKVKIRAENNGAKVRIVVEDNGIGIPIEAQGRIFEMFQRLHPDTDYAGTGVGLAIVRKAIERIGGEAGVDSEPGKGSSFWVELEKA
jgi:signal transduction histidine kinase